MNIKLAIFSGFLGSLGSVFGKLSFEWDEVFQGYWKLLVIVIFQLLMVLCNTAGLAVFSRSLLQTDSTVVATVTNTACNFIFSGFLGIIIFHELITFEWFIGTLFTIIGFFIITSSEITVPDDTKTK